MQFEWKQCEVLPLARDQRMTQTAVATFFSNREKGITQNKLL
jgi:hypothetical protein